MPNLNALIASQQSHAATGGHYIGSLIWWSLNGNRVSHTQLKDLADLHGLPERYLPAEVKPASAFRRAWRHASKKLPCGLLLRQVNESDKGLHIGLVQEKTDAQAHELSYDHLITIAFSKEHHTIQTSEEHDIVNQLRELYAHHLELTTRDIRTMLSRFVSETGVSLRESGGIYFVSAPHQSTIESMSAVLQSIGHNHLHQLPLYDSPLAQDILNEVASKTLDDEIRKLSEELEDFMSDEKTRTSTLRKRLDVFDGLRRRVNTFAGVLSFKASDMLDKVEDLESDLKRHLGIQPTDTSQPGVETFEEPAPHTSGFSTPTLLAFDLEAGF